VWTTDFLFNHDYAPKNNASPANNPVPIITAVAILIIFTYSSVPQTTQRIALRDSFVQQVGQLMYHLPFGAL